MVNPRTFVVFALCLPVFTLQALMARADDPSLKEMFLRDYPEASKALENRLSSAKGVVKHSEERRSRVQIRVSNETLTFECNHPYMARVVSGGEITTTKADKKNVDAHGTCVVL
jgi:hypothetical protein